MSWFRRKRGEEPDEPAYAVALADFAEDVDRLQDGELLFLRSAWEGQQGPEQQSAWREVEEAVLRSGREREAEDLEVGLVRWSGAMSRPIGYTSIVGTTDIHLESDLRRQALPVLRDAGTAFLLQDVLSPEAFATLVGPWLALTEEGEAS
jgi:hypothetical protein